LAVRNSKALWAANCFARATGPRQRRQIDQNEFFVPAALLRALSCILIKKAYVQIAVVEPNSHQSPTEKPGDESAATRAETPCHAHYEVLLERHLDGDLTPAERDELFAHLETCTRCREILEAEEALVDQLSRIPRLLPPSDLRAKLVEEALRYREEVTSGWLPIESENSQQELAVRRIRPSRTGLFVQFFLLFSVLFFLLVVDLGQVPGLGQLQFYLRSALRFVWQEGQRFVQQSVTEPQPRLRNEQLEEHNSAPPTSGP
jgi:hypothetical protein